MGEILHETESLCPVCLKKIPARYERIDGKAYMLKSCAEHGDFSVLFWRDADMYERWMKQGVHAPAKDRGKPEKRGCPYDCGLCDEHKSGTCTSILEITYRCNMNCAVCFADANAEQFEPDIDRIRDMYAAALKSNPFCSVQLSGGEPTVREDLPEIIRLGKAMGVVHLQVNTNGIKLANVPGYAQKLKDAGCDLIYLQFDGLDDAIYREIRTRDMLDIKLRAIENCEKAGLAILLVPVVIPGVNLHRIGEIVEFAKKHIPTIRGIHFQPVSYFGRCELPEPEMRLTIPRILREIERQMEGLMKPEDFAGGGAESAYCSFHASYQLQDDGSVKALPRRRSACCCKKSEEARDFVAGRWGAQSAESGDEDAFDRFLREANERVFTVSGMAFQDAYNLDLERLRRCYINEADPVHGMVPFCAYNLTARDGRALYRR